MVSSEKSSSDLSEYTLFEIQRSRSDSVMVVINIFHFQSGSTVKNWNVSNKLNNKLSRWEIYSGQTHIIYIYNGLPDWKTSTIRLQLSERLASLGIMGAQSKGPLKLLVPSQHYRMEGFKGDSRYADRR